ncbi:MAG: glycosyltransferase family 39 protein [Candidatus Peregrinibacteria bacterium]
MRTSDLERGILLGVILAGILLRFVYPTFIEFKGDELNALVLAIRQFKDGLAFSGIMSSVGIPNPPMFTWLLILLVAFSHHPVWVTEWVMAANVVGIVLLFLWIKKMMGGVAGLRAAALLAASPWAILYSRKIWQQDLLIPFLIAFCWLLFSQWQHPRAWKLVAASFMFTVALQLHMSVLFAVPGFIVAIAALRPHVRLRQVLLVSIPFIALYVPYVLHGSLAGLSHVQSAAGGVSYWLLWLFKIPVGLGFTYVLGEEGFRAFSTLYPVWLFSGIFCIGALLVGGACIETLWYVLRTLRVGRISAFADWCSLLCVLSIVSVLCGYALFDIAVYPHYFIILVPFLFLLPVLSLERVAGLAPMVARVVRIVLVLLLVSQILFMMLFFQFVVHHHDQITGDYGVPFHFQDIKWLPK